MAYRKAYLFPVARGAGLVAHALLVALVGTLAACRPNDAATPAAVLYSSVDETFLRRVVDAYERATGRSVIVVGDAEAGKTTGLVNKLRLEREAPRADVFWSSEHVQTIQLAREGLFEAYASPAADGIPGRFRDPDRRWTGFALRYRVVAFDPRRTPPGAAPRTWEDLARPSIAARAALANPLAGTTRSHMAALHAQWGNERFRRFLQALVDGGVTIVDGNSSAVRALLDGRVDWAATDSDDVRVVRARGAAIAMVAPDMADGGALTIPNTVALVRGGPHPRAGRQLIDYVLSPAVEAMLAASDSGNVPVRSELRDVAGLEIPPASTVGFGAIAEHMDAAIAACREILLR